MEAKQILIVCGEASGDLHAANLAREILKLDPQIKISAVGGTQLRQAGAQILYDINGLSVMGLFDVLKNLPRFFALKNFLLGKVKAIKPALIIMVDFSGFNLRFAKAINNTVPVVYYISPQVWASRPGRVGTIRRYIRKMIVLFKFEEEFYKKHGISVEYVGHPLLDSVKPALDKKTFLQQCGLAENKTTLALLPGSRKAEIELILPVMLKSAEIIQRQMPSTQFVIAKSQAVDLKTYQQIISRIGQAAHPVRKNFPNGVKIIEGRTYDCLNSADFAFVCSGTATLETAILNKPFAIIYKMNWLNYFLYRPQVRVPYIGMANIVAGEKIVPEFIQFNARPKKIAQECLSILREPSRRNVLQEKLIRIKSLLGEPGASERAAKIILSVK